MLIVNKMNQKRKEERGGEDEEQERKNLWNVTINIL
jgi:hypothetical protein